MQVNCRGSGICRPRDGGGLDRQGQTAKQSGVIRAITAIGWGVCLTTVTAHAAEAPPDLHGKLAGACVEVFVDRHLNGSGCLAPEAGYAFTAAHVVARKPESLELRLGDGRLVPARVVARDLRHDAALLRLDATATAVPAGLPLADAMPAAGSALWLFGAPQFRHAVMFPGTLANANLTYEWMADLGRAIECRHVAGLAPKGVSGGPWVDARAQVVGLQSGGMTDRGVFCNLSFATPASALRKLLESKRDQPSATFGAAVEELGEQPAPEIRRFPRDADGLIVKAIIKDGPASRAGLAEGIMIVRCAGKRLKLRDEFYQLLATLKPGDNLEIETIRPGQPDPLIVLVKLGQ